MVSQSDCSIVRASRQTALRTGTSSCLDASFDTGVLGGGALGIISARSTVLSVFPYSIYQLLRYVNDRKRGRTTT